jgi:hypothetical protein
MGAKVLQSGDNSNQRRRQFPTACTRFWVHKSLHGKFRCLPGLFLLQCGKIHYLPRSFQFQLTNSVTHLLAGIPVCGKSDYLPAYLGASVRQI